MEKLRVQQDPKLNHMSEPVWYHTRGSKIGVEKFDDRNKLLVLSGSAACVRITRCARTVDEGWYVDWEVRYSQQEKAGGRIVLSSPELSAAFGLTAETGEWSGWLIQRFGADSAKHGRYIRWEKFLNIPSPGTGRDGDPNISIYLREEIQHAIQQLLA